MLKANKCMCLLQTIIKILATRTLSRGNEGSREPTDNQSLHNMMRLIEHLKLTFFFPFHIKWNCKKMEKLALIRVSTIGFCYPSSSKRILWYAYLDRVGRWQKKSWHNEEYPQLLKVPFEDERNLKCSIRSMSVQIRLCKLWSVQDLGGVEAIIEVSLLDDLFSLLTDLFSWTLMIWALLLAGNRKLLFDLIYLFFLF